MKKSLLSLLALLMVAIIFIYFLIPAKITFSKITIINSNMSIAKRFVMNKNNWYKWFPGKVSHDTNNKTDVVYRFANLSYYIPESRTNGLAVIIKSEQDSIKSIINIIPLLKDTIAVEWKGEMPETFNPLKRLHNYMRATQLHNNMAIILKNLQTFLINKDNVYGIHIEQKKVAETLVISTTLGSNHYPTLLTIYDLIKKLQAYISVNGGKQISYPMININQQNNTYKTMVAIPINKKIRETNEFSMKRMVPSNVLIAEVKGGDSTIYHAYRQMENFMNDFQRTPIMIPYESIVIDRMKEPDTSKWITKIFFPVL